MVKKQHTDWQPTAYIRKNITNISMIQKSYFYRMFFFHKLFWTYVTVKWRCIEELWYDSLASIEQFQFVIQWPECPTIVMWNKHVTGVQMAEPVRQHCSWKQILHGWIDIINKGMLITEQDYLFIYLFFVLFQLCFSHLQVGNLPNHCS